MVLSRLSAITFCVVSHVVFQVPPTEPSSIQIGVKCQELKYEDVTGQLTY
jgi:hypothetical protein